MRYALPILLGRAVRWLARLRGGGSALPGGVLLRLAPRFLQHAVELLPGGVVVVSGSNGKSTTTAMLAAVLRAHGVRVFTNSAGGNLEQGLASSMLAEVPLSGRLQAELAVLEIDEGYGPELAERLQARHALLINLQIDQLNRFFEPDRVYRMLARIARAASGTVVLNAADENLRALGAELAAEGADARYFGIAEEVVAAAPHGLATARRVDAVAASDAPLLATLLAIEGTTATIEADGAAELRLPARGVHYGADAAAAIAMARTVLGAAFAIETAAAAISGLTAVYGRGELLGSGAEAIEVIMMKNPPSMQLNLDALDAPPERLLLAIDEGTPDPSWLYDIDVSRIDHVDIVTGTKAWQLATRLAYAGVPVHRVIPEMKPAVAAFVALPSAGPGPKTALVNYELMMELRRILGYLELETPA